MGHLFDNFRKSTNGFKVFGFAASYELLVRVNTYVPIGMLFYDPKKKQQANKQNELNNVDTR